MRVLVFGATGILGSTILGMLPRQHHIGYYASCVYDDPKSILEVLQNINPDAIINCAGDNLDNAQMIRVNALFPHILAGVTEIPILHASVDRVFNGRLEERAYTVKDTPDAVDMFGRTKVIGEVRANRFHNIRMSFISRDKGFVKNLIDNPNEFKGLTNVLWSGSTVEAVAWEIVGLLYHINNLPGTIHLTTKESISRYDAAKLVLKAYNKDNIELASHTEPIANYALVPTHALPSLEEAIKYWQKPEPILAAEGAEIGISE